MNKEFSNTHIDDDNNLLFKLNSFLLNEENGIPNDLLLKVVDEIRNAESSSFYSDEIFLTEKLWNNLNLACFLNGRESLDYLYVPISIQKKVALVIDRYFCDDALKVLDNFFKHPQSGFLSFRANNDFERHIILNGKDDVQKILSELESLDAFSTAKFVAQDFSFTKKSL